MLSPSFASRLPHVTLLVCALAGAAAHAAMTVVPTAVSAGAVTLALNSSTPGTGSFVLLRASRCGTATQTLNGQDSTGATAARTGALPLIAATDGLYSVRGLAQLQDYTVCATNGIDTGTTTFRTPAMAAFGAPAWQAVGEAGFSSGVASFQSLAIAPDGTPYVAYTDSANGDKLTVMRYTAGSWIAVGGAGFSQGAAGEPSLAFTPNGTPYVAYQDGANGSRTTVMRYNGSSWVTVGSAGFSSGDASFHSLAFAPDGAPYVAYRGDGASGHKSAVMRYDGVSWVAVGSTGFSASEARYTSLAFAPDGTPHVGYVDYANGLKATVMRYVHGSWETVGNAGLSADGAYYLSLAFAPDGAPYVAYADVANGYGATVMRYNGSSWESVGSAGFSGGGGSFLSLAFSSDGKPYVAYMDAGGKTAVMRYDASHWLTVGSTSIPPGSAMFQSLAVAPDGTPYVAYQDAGTGSRSTVIRLTGTAAAPTAVQAVPTATPGEATVSFTPPPSNGGSAIIGYTVTATPGGATCTATPPETSCVVRGLPIGIAHAFAVVAINGAGASPASDPSPPVTLAAAAPASIPALSTWALLVVSTLLAAYAALVLRRGPRWAAVGANKRFRLDR